VPKQISNSPQPGPGDLRAEILGDCAKFPRRLADSLKTTLGSIARFRILSERCCVKPVRKLLNQGNVVQNIFENAEQDL
jgi:hypothetical protein